MENMTTERRIRKLIEIGKQMFGDGAALGRACVPVQSAANISRWGKEGGALPQVKQLAALLEAVGGRILLPAEHVRDFARIFQLADTEKVQHDLVALAAADKPESVIEYVKARKHVQPNTLFHPDYLESLGVDAVNCFLLSIHNDAMMPTLRAGDQVLADTSKTHVGLTGELFVILANDTIMVRRLARIGDELHVTQDLGARTIKLMEDQQQAVTILGKVVWTGKRVV